MRGLPRELNPEPLALEVRIIPLDQAEFWIMILNQFQREGVLFTIVIVCTIYWLLKSHLPVLDQNSQVCGG